MAWWIWVLMGIGLLLVEILTPGGFFALFFGASAILVAGLSTLGFQPWLQWLLFAGLGVVLLLAFRRRLVASMPRESRVDLLVGEVAFPLADLAPGGTGTAELRGSPWTARNESGVTLARGQRCRVSRISELVLYIQPE